MSRSAIAGKLVRVEYPTLASSSKHKDPKGSKACKPDANVVQLKIIQHMNSLFDAGFDINQVNPTGHTALTLASSKNHADVVKFILRKCGAIREHSAAANPAATLTARNNQDAARRFGARGTGDEDDADHEDEDDPRLRRKAQCVLDIDKKPKGLFSAMEIALSRPYPKIVYLLAKGGADVEKLWNPKLTTAPPESSSSSSSSAAAADRGRRDGAAAGETKTNTSSFFLPPEFENTSQNTVLDWIALHSSTLLNTSLFVGSSIASQKVAPASTVALQAFRGHIRWLARFQRLIQKDDPFLAAAAAAADAAAAAAATSSATASSRLSSSAGPIKPAKNSATSAAGKGNGNGDGDGDGEEGDDEDEEDLSDIEDVEEYKEEDDWRSKSSLIAFRVRDWDPATMPLNALFPRDVWGIVTQYLTRFRRIHRHASAAGAQ